MSQPRHSSGGKDFVLEVDDRTEDEKSKSKNKKKDKDKDNQPMDSNYLAECVDATPKIRFNANFDKGVRGVKESPEQRARERFDADRIFKAVVKRDITELIGLEAHLKSTGKRLSHSLYIHNGKTALLKALLNLKDGRNETVEYLINVSEKTGDLAAFINATHKSHLYAGQSALHVAIERRNFHYVQLLVEKGADVHIKACGKFFQPNKGACFYFGELPLSLAACTNQEKVVDFLMQNDHQCADVREQDSQGNTVLHALVVVADNSPESTEFVVRMYDHILIKTAELHPKIRLEDIENKQGLTPIKLSAKTGKVGLFEHMLRREFQSEKCRHLSRKFTEWVYGPVYSSLYDLASLDTYEENSVLEIIVYGSRIPNRLEMLQVEPLNRLLEDKWNRFARYIFLVSFVCYVVYLAIFTTTAYWHNEGEMTYALLKDPKGRLLFAGQVFSAVGAVYFLIKGVLDMWRKPPKLDTLIIDGYTEMLFLLQAMLFLVCAVLYICGRDEYLGSMVLCVALSWVNLLYYSRGFKHMGIYSVMIQKMILGDILRFLLVYVVFLIGFSAAVVTLLDDPIKQVNATKASNSTSKSRALFESVTESEKADCKKPSFKSIYFTTLELFKFTIGMGDLEFTEDYKYVEVFYVLLILYIVLTYILLLNMLIALMNKTVDRLSDESTNIWKLQLAITILDMEHYLPQCCRSKLRSGVDENLGCGNGEDRRRCLRVEEVNWKKWNTNLCIHEDPGSSVTVLSPDPVRDRGRSWRGFLRDFSRRRPRSHFLDVPEGIPLASVSRA
ncbi:transient receptor potential cation channel subfamily V member 1-like [Chanos chanos]|uniref:Transient receptor potential cation channel subfamily V member 1-like n=1 Tax=Chanos chanos TaxID=29144 RepID=A0A6J2WX65_CHACN|nr:transient receptor potential cation channel subfamily V member 1-like [Chanos chanos]